MAGRGAATKLSHGEVLTAIANGLVGIVKEYYGRGPTEAKAYYEDDLVVCLFRRVLTRVEQTLRDGGRVDVVMQQRAAFQELVRARYASVVEHATGRRVIAAMSGGNQQDPEICCEVFVLEPDESSGEKTLPAAVEAGDAPRPSERGSPTA